MTVFKWEAIKPKDIQVREIRGELQKALKEIERRTLKLFEATTRTWDTDVEFTSNINITDGSLIVETDNEIYGFVNEGTEPHLIAPVNADRLAFASGYTPKTIPNSIGSRNGGPSGNTVFADAVQHPGTEARNFDEAIQQKIEPSYARIIQAAITQGARKAGIKE